MKKLKLLTVGLTLAGLVPIGAGIPASAHAAPAATTMQADPVSSTISCLPPGGDDNKLEVSTLALTTEPEPMLDANGVAAKTYAGFYTEHSVVTNGNTTYVGFYDAANSNNLTVAMRTGSTGPWTFTAVTDATGKPVPLTGDSHNNIAMAIDSLGQLHIVANVHSSAMTYWRSASAAEPTKLVFSNALVTTATINSAGNRSDQEGYVTYPRFITDQQGKLHLSFRSGWSEAGQIYIYEFDTAAGRWINPQGFTPDGAPRSVLSGWSGSQYGPYPDHLAYNPADGFYYMSYTWQGTPKAISTQHISMMRTKDFTTWTTGLGAPLSVPVLYGNSDTLVEAVPENSGLLNSNVKTGFDREGKPTVTYVREQGDTTVVSVARTNATKKGWVVSTLTPWTGKNDLNESTNFGTLLLGSGTMATEGSSHLTVSYGCHGQSRTLTIGDGKTAGSSVLVSNQQKTVDVLPESLTRSEFPNDDKNKPMYDITWRTVVGKSETGSVILKWEAAEMIATGNAPVKRFPKGGSTLMIATTGQVPGEKPVVPEEVELGVQPEKMLDANGVAAKAFAGFYTDSAVTTRGDTTYVAFYAADRTLTVAQRTGTTGPWAFNTPRDGSGQQVLLTGDTRNNIAMSIDSLGQLHIVANVNSSAMTYWRSASPAEPTNLVFANSLVTTATYGAEGKRSDDEGYVSQPRFLTDQDGVLRLSFRAGWVEAGKLYTYEFNTGTGTWSNPLGGVTPVLNGWGGTGNPNFGPSTDSFQYNPTDKHYYLSYIWQGKATVASAHSVGMIRTRDFKTWTTGLGTPISMPVLHDTPATVVAPVPENSGLLSSNVKTGFDNAGRPTVVYTHDFKDKTAVSVARMNQARKGWVISTLTPWQEKIDLSQPQNYTRLLLSSGTTGDKPNLTVAYGYHGKARVLTIGDGNGIGRSVLISDQAKSVDVMPAAITKPEFPNAAYRITWRTATTRSDAGTVIVKWEAGAMIADGTQPDPKSYPAEGSTLLFAVAKK